MIRALRARWQERTMPAALRCDHGRPFTRTCRRCERDAAALSDTDLAAYLVTRPTFNPFETAAYLDWLYAQPTAPQTAQEAQR